ncbi:MAG TPA: Flp pilus assembly protein CpaB [Phycisphaerae bacterium]|nr:Flp pilus assembly protein CpaB [Phycisphaerae bacterium]
MKSKALIPLVIGLAVGLVAIKMGLDVVKKAKGANQGGPVVDIVVAARSIPLATGITEQMVKTVKTPRELAPTGIFNTVSDVVGRVNRAEIPKGAPVMGSLLAPPGTSPGMPSLIPDGFRAVSVKVDEDTQVSGFLQPGCHVDVAAVMTASVGGRRDTISKVILQNVEVAAVGQSLASEGSGEANLTRSVTLLVRPRDVPKLHLAASKGKIRLALRSRIDESSDQFMAMTEDQLLADEKVAQAVGDRPSVLGGLVHGLGAGLVLSPKATVSQTGPMLAGPWMVEVYEGAKSKQYTFRDTDSMDLMTGMEAGSPNPVIRSTRRAADSGGRVSGGWTSGGSGGVLNRLGSGTSSAFSATGGSAEESRDAVEGE